MYFADIEALVEDRYNPWSSDIFNDLSSGTNAERVAVAAAAAALPPPPLPTDEDFYDDVASFPDIVHRIHTVKGLMAFVRATAPRALSSENTDVLGAALVEAYVNTRDVAQDVLLDALRDLIMHKAAEPEPDLFDTVRSLARHQEVALLQQVLALPCRVDHIGDLFRGIWEEAYLGAGRHGGPAPWIKVLGVLADDPRFDARDNFERLWPRAESMVNDAVKARAVRDLHTLWSEDAIGVRRLWKGVAPIRRAWVEAVTAFRRAKG